MSTNRRKYWWIISVSGYGSFAYRGTEQQAEERRAAKAEWEGGVGRKRRASKEDRKQKMIRWER